MTKIIETVSPEVVSNLAEELLNNIGTYTKRGLEEQDLRLYQRKELDFRILINNVFPSMLVIDYNSIRKELEVYNDLIPNLKQLIGSDYIPPQSDFNVSKLSKTEIDIIIHSIKAASKVLVAEPITSIELQRKLQTIVNSNDKNILKQARDLFQPVYKLVDITDKDVFVYPSFGILTDRLRRALDIGLSTATLAYNNININSVSSYLDFGHTATTIDNKLQFNSPKLLAIIFDVLNSSDNKQQAIKQAYKASTKFLETTKQTEETIEITKEFGDGFVKLFVSIGGSVVKFENSIINQRRGSILERKETRGVNRVVLAQLAAEIAKTGSSLGKKISRLLLLGRSSPSLLEHITDNILNSITGKKTKTSKSSSKTKKTTKETLKEPVLSGFTKDKGSKLPKLSKPVLRSELPSSEANLSKLLLFINANLQNMVSANMGNGTRKDILNYRTGRFAESVQVERLTQSKQGMITAFYSYMKNPYATFSHGGKQEFPRTRDPKLLISQSIRELAKERVTARLRAVVI